MDTAKRSYRDLIWDLVEPVVESEGTELVQVECLRMKSRWLVRIYIDKEGGVTLDDCAGISHQVGDLLDVHNIPVGPYTLEVSSPGLDRPLAREKDFIAFKGHAVKIRTKGDIEGRKNFKGVLLDYIEREGTKEIVLDVDGKHIHIPRNLIHKANLEYEF